MGPPRLQKKIIWGIGRREGTPSSRLGNKIKRINRQILDTHEGFWMTSLASLRRRRVRAAELNRRGFELELGDVWTLPFAAEAVVGDWGGPIGCARPFIGDAEAAA